MVAVALIINHIECTVREKEVGWCCLPSLHRNRSNPSVSKKPRSGFGAAASIHSLWIPDASAAYLSFLCPLRDASWVGPFRIIEYDI